MKRARLLLFVTFLLGFRSEVAAVDFSVHGYYRTRGVANDNLDLQLPNHSIPNSDDRFGLIAYNQMRLRLEPILKLNDNLVVHGMFDFLDNILYGTSETRQLNVYSPVIGTLGLPPGGGSFRMTGGAAGENGAINVRAIWAEALFPLGLFRIGRQPSHWGLGIFQNDGRGRQGDFGDIADRILYLARYDTGEDAGVSAGLLWDIPFEAQFDPRIKGLDIAPLSYNRNTNQVAALLLYEDPTWSAGLFGGFRHRAGAAGATTTTVTDAAGNRVAAGIDGNTNLFFSDLYARYQYEQYRFRLEGIYVGGKVTTGLATNGIAFQGIGAANANNPCGSGGIICMTPNQPIQVFMAAFEADASYDFGGEWNVKSGFAQGDGSILSTKITQLGFRPDYQIALMMFNMPLGTSPSFYDATSGRKLAGGVSITSNYINNALYLSTGYKHHFDVKSLLPKSDGLKIGGQVTTAWAHQKNINIDFSQLTGTANLPTLTENANSIWQRWYGVEVDLSAESKFFGHFLTILEGGGLLPGRAYDIDVALFNPGSIVQPIPFDKAKIAWMLRLTAMYEF